jgi:D-3-phosphoglycerate dehydrogenase
MSYQQILLVGCEKLDETAREEISTLSAAPVIVVDAASLGEAELQATAHRADALIIGLSVDITAATVAHCQRLRYIGICGTSTRRIDMAAARRRSVTVQPVLDYCNRETAEFVLTHAEMAARGFGPILWRDEPVSLKHRKLGVLGLGAVGLELAQLARAWGLNVAYFSRRRRPEVENSGIVFLQRDQLLSESEILSLHTPAHQMTLGGKDFATLRGDTILVNTCVGPVLDQGGLANWLRAGKGACAFFDAVAGDYLAARELPRLFVSPRAAYRTAEALDTLRRAVVANLRAHLESTCL